MCVYKLHQHTGVCNGCGVIMPEELVQVLRDEAYEIYTVRTK